MTWPFENDTSAITKKIAKNDIDKNRVKKVFSLTTIVFATALLMMLIMFESGYETTKDRMAEGQPQVVFYDLSQQQIELLYSEENIESIKVTETENGYDASITIVDATKMTQYGFSSAVDNISSKYDIHHVTRNDLFIDSLPNGGLLNQKNMVLMGVAIFIIIVSALVIYNVFYLSVVNQVRQFGQLRTVGMTQQQTKKIIRYERKILCRIGVPIGLLIGGLAGYLLQPDGWDWIAAVFWGIIISLIINFVVKVSLNRPTKIALSISPILSSKYMMERFDCKVTNKEKRKLSSLGLAIISITSHWKSILVSVLSLGLSGLLFVLAATYTASIDPESIVKKDVYQYGQFAIETTGKYSEKVSEIENFKQKIMEFPSISNIKQVVETDISWAGKNSTGKDQLSIITANDFASIQQFSESGDLDYQQLVQSNQIVAVNGVEGMTVMISSHILSEIDQMATVVGIINQGCLIFQERMSVLDMQREPQIILRTSDNNHAFQLLKKANPQRTTDGLQIGALTDEQTGAVVQCLCSNGISVYRVEEHRESLEDIFLNLTGKELTL